MTRTSLSTDDLAGREADAPRHDDPRHDDHPRNDDDLRNDDLRDAGDPYPDEPTHAAPEQDEQYAPLLEDREAGVFLDRWRDVQARFVDDPRAAAREADALVAELMQSLAQRFSEQKGTLQETWDGGGEPQTEQLRQALQEYRSFFQRLLST